MPREALRWPDGSMSWGDYSEPVLGGDEVRVRSEFAAAKHGTELAFSPEKRVNRGRYDSTLQLFVPEPPAGASAPSRAGGVGNMTVGTVVEAGAEVKTLAVGDRVLLHGGFRQTHVRPEGRCWKIPASMSWKSAVCLDPADFAMGAIRDGHARIGDAVAVFGLGAIGLMCVQFARLAGASLVIGVEPLPNRRAIAQRLGADVVLDPDACDAGLEIKQATARRGADVVLEYSGSETAMQAALRGVAHGGNVVAGAFPPPYKAGLDFGAEAHLNIPNIIFSRACSRPDRDHPRWDEARILATCLRLLQDGRLSGEAIVTPVVDFADVLEHYPLIGIEPNKYVKIGVKF